MFVATGGVLSVSSVLWPLQDVRKAKIGDVAPIPDGENTCMDLNHAVIGLGHRVAEINVNVNVNVNSSLAISV